MVLSFINGFSLLEILIALLIFAMCLLGIGGLENLALQRMHVSYLRSLAVIQVNNMAERMRVGMDAECSAWIETNKKNFPRGRASCTSKQILLCWKNRSEKEECVIGKLT
jgi:type IV pilus assembly protein PilV